MIHIVKRQFLFLLGVVFFIIGLIGVILPGLPTTIFMILAASCFAKSSPRFHQALLNNRYIGADLKRWEKDKTMLRATKKRATWVIVITFTISIIILMDRLGLQVMLVAIAAILLFFLWRVPETREEVVAEILDDVDNDLAAEILEPQSDLKAESKGPNSATKLSKETDKALDKDLNKPQNKALD